LKTEEKTETTAAKPSPATPPKAEEKPEEVAAEAVEEDELEQLRKELEGTRAQADEYLDGWQRSQAEFANYRKRQEAEQKQRAQMITASLVVKILPLLDDLERAAQTLPPNLHDLTWIEGVFLIKRKLELVLESEEVRAIETVGQSFDPLYHEAVTYEEVAGREDGQIVGEVQRGYMLDERVIRPALVRVARAPQAPVETEETEKEESAG
jgi:molecular chaperone GrpE